MNTRSAGVRIGLAAVVSCCVVSLWNANAEQAGKVLRVAPHSNLTIIDPVWTTAYITQEHGYMIYDTLFAQDSQGGFHPQMVDRYQTSGDNKTWTFTLRDGLEFHDGSPVTSDDVIASLRRWGQRDSLGITLLSVTEGFEAVDKKTFRIKLKEPYPLMLESLGKSSTNVPFIMPKRIAETPADKQISETIGSGPFIFAKDEWKPGEKIVYLKNPKYKPRPEPSNGLAGGKIAKVDRVEWLIIKDPQTQVNALVAGEIDMIESPAHESYAAFKDKPDIQLEGKAVRRQAMLRFNHLQPPFNNVKIRQAAMAALDQTALLRAQVGIPTMFSTCLSVYPCGSPLSTSKGMEQIGRGDVKRAKALLKEAGYDGTPVVIMQPTDLAVLARFPVMAAQLLRQAGFKVDLQAMDWQTLVSRRAKKDPPDKGGWNILITNFTRFDLVNPVAHPMLAAGCDKAWFGWACDSEVERLRQAFLRASTDAERKALGEQVQVRAMELGLYFPIGEYWFPHAFRRNVHGVIEDFNMVLWNVDKEPRA